LFGPDRLTVVVLRLPTRGRMSGPCQRPGRTAFLMVYKTLFLSIGFFSWSPPLQPDSIDYNPFPKPNYIMVKLISYLTLSVFIISPAFASSLWDLESRDESHLFDRELDESVDAVFAREILGLYARQGQPAEYEDLARRFHINFGKVLKGAASLLFRRELEADNADGMKHRHRAHRRHQSFSKHELPAEDNAKRSFDEDLVERDFDDDLLERDLDYELMERDLFERVYVDLD
jgi:hypothetical protein